MNEELKQRYAAALHRAIDNTLGTEPSSDEPVAWMYKVNGEHQTWSFIEPPTDAYDEGSLIPLYTHPAKTLTDEEIYQLAEYHGINDWLYETSVIDFAKAILRKAQEK